MPEQDINKPEGDPNTDAKRYLEEAKKASKANDLLAYKQYLELAEETVTDDEFVKSQIADARNRFDSILKESIVHYLQALSNRSGKLDPFIAALKALTGPIFSTYQFTEEQLQLIAEAQKFQDAKALADTGVISASRIGQFRDSYIIYDQFKSLKANEKREQYVIDTGINPETEEVGVQVYSYTEYYTILNSEWVKKSRDECEKQIIYAQKIAIEDPVTAQANLNYIFTKDFTEEVKNLFTGETEIRTTREFPFTDVDSQKIKNYIETLREPCAQVAKAKTARDEALNAGTPYTRYEKLIKARDIKWFLPDDPMPHGLPLLDYDIHQVYESAVNNRCDEINTRIVILNKELDSFPRLSDNLISSQGQRLEDDINTLKGKTDAWPGTGVSLNISMAGEPFKLVIPERLHELGKQCQGMTLALLELQNAYNNLKQSDQFIQEALMGSEPKKRREGVLAFKELSKDKSIKKFMGFEKLEAFVSRHSTIEFGENNIKQTFGEQDWSRVVKLCKEFEKKAEYEEDCPPETKKRIAGWKQVAENNIKLQKLNYWVKKENFLAANQILGDLKKNGIDIKPVSEDIALIEQVEKDGKLIWDFYTRSIHPFGLDHHVLLEILQEPDEILLRTEHISDIDRRVVHKILMKDGSNVTYEQREENTVNYLGRFLQRFSLDQIVGLLEKLRYVSGMDRASRPGWPTYSISFAKFEAGLLARYLSLVVRELALNSIKNADITEERGWDALNLQSVIYSIQHLGIALSDEESALVKRVQIKWADRQVKSLPLKMSQNRLDIWEEIVRIYGKGGEIGSKYSVVKVDWYVNQVQGFRVEEKYQEALNCISQAFKDDDVGMVWQLYLEKAYVCYEMQMLEEADRALDGLGRIKKKESGDVKKLKLNIKIGKLRQRYEGDPLEFLKKLIVIWKAENSPVVEETIRNAYEVFSQEHGQGIIEFIPTDLQQAWQKFLSLRILEEVVTSEFSRLNKESEKFVEDLLPSLYFAGIRLLIDSNTFADKYTTPGISLHDCIKNGTSVHDRLKSYDTLIQGLLAPEKISPDWSLEQTVRKVINKNVRDQQLRDTLLASLTLAIKNENENDDEEVHYKILKEKQAGIFKKLESLKNCVKNWEESISPQKWYSVAHDTIWANIQARDPWAGIKGLIPGQDSTYEETQKVILCTEKWNTILNSIHNIYERLRGEFGEENFEKAGQSCIELKQKFEVLPDFSSTKLHLEVRKKLMDELVVNNEFNQLRLGGLDNIAQAITELLKEINAWKQIRDLQHNNLSEAKGLKMSFKGQAAQFVIQYEKHKQKLRRIDRDNMLNTMDNYLDLNTELDVKEIDKSTARYQVPVGLEEDAENLPRKVEGVENLVDRRLTSSSFWDRFGLGKKKNRTGPDQLVLSVESSSRIKFPLVAHGDKIEYLTLINPMSAESVGANLNKSSERSSKFSVESMELQGETNKIKGEFVKIKKYYDLCCEKWKFPSPNDFVGYLKNHQYDNYAYTIIKARLIGSKSEDEDTMIREYVETFMKLRRAD